MRSSRLGAALRVTLAFALAFVCIWQAHASPKHPAKHTAQDDVPVVMLSDLHFDPYMDPAKFPQLRAADASVWKSILDAPPSPTQAADFAALQNTCKERGADSSWAILSGSLHAAARQQPKPLFVTVSGDLLTHAFDCRFRTLSPGATADDISAFAEKTIAFIAQQLRAAFAGVPVYMALGNNDSGCKDYWEAQGSRFLRSTAHSFAADVPASERKDLAREFSQRGDYNVALPHPMHHARLIVLQDMFESLNYKTCGGKPETSAASAQIAWLRAQLAKAHEHHERVWVMAHIPPGIDVYSSFHKFVTHPDQLCTVTEPKQFLTSNALNDTLTEFADVVRLAIFAHTHMDEMKLLHNDRGGVVPGKFVPSVSPINGNSPAFTVAQVNPQTATMMDYSVFVAGGPDASAWHETYSYSQAYGMPDYSAKSVQQLTSALAADKTGEAANSRAYQRWFYPGDSGLFALGLRQIWPAYACSIVESGGPAFHECMCPAQPPQK